MSVEIIPFVLGVMQNNTYLVVDVDSRAAVVVDPSFGPGEVLAYAQDKRWQIRQVWLTHAHFDHYAGSQEVAGALNPPLPVGLHPADLDLWRRGGGGRDFGLQVDPGPEPGISFYHGQRLHLGGTEFEVRHAPGHTRGHIVLYCASAGALLCGDVIFQGGIGRTDLPGGDMDALLHSIRTQVLTLPDETRLLSGHGPETTVGEEKENNPFLNG
jgi:hydroxyacylglutathione hydrolase